MARVTYVKKAQQRYATVPVLNEDGTPKQTPMISKRTGEQKVTKRGRPVFLTVTAADKSKPLPPLTCDAPGCGKPIEVGTPYKHVTPKSGPYGGRQRNRHQSCPGWEIWDLSNSWAARIARETELPMRGFEPETPDDVENLANEIAEAVRGLASESEEAADNIEEGFGHETQQSEEARERAQNLESWADDIEGIDVPDLPEPEETDCEACGGTGETQVEVDGVPQEENGDAVMEECADCEGTGQVTPEEPTEEQMNEWREEAIQALQDEIDNCPV